MKIIWSQIGVAFILKNKKGDFYLVELKQNEEQMVINLISQFNNGVIKVFKEKTAFNKKQQIIKVLNINYMKKSIGYLKLVYYCPLCGREDVYRERMFTKKPKDHNKRSEWIDKYDYCEAL